MKNRTGEEYWIRIRIPKNTMQEMDKVKMVTCESMQKIVLRAINDFLDAVPMELKSWQCPKTKLESIKRKEK